MLSLPLEIFNNILNYLNVNEIAALRETCKELNIKINSPTICTPYLNRLKKLDKKISVIPPKEYQEDWCYHRFVEGFNQIAERQQAEIEYFRTADHLDLVGPKKNVIKELYKRLVSFNAPATTLEALEERHEILENFNAAIIENKMDPVYHLLTLRNCLTRFPVRVFNKENKVYWSTLSELHCLKNPLLRSLPSELGGCTELTALVCEDSMLKSLPPELGNCTKLTILACAYNLLESLPPELGKCSNLGFLFCSNNKLRSFPRELGQCPIKRLNCSDNLLSSLPIEILNWSNYYSLPNFENNKIIIPVAFKDKFGDAWYNDTIKTQNPNFVDNLPELISALHAINKSNSTISPLITSSSTPEPIQRTGGEKRTLETDHDNNDKEEDKNPTKKPRN